MNHDYFIINFFIFNFEIGVNYLRKFHKEFGHPNPKSDYVNNEGYKLGNFVRGIKSRFSKLTDKEILFFESFEGWQWSKRDALWQKGYKCLVIYVQINKHASPPQNFINDDGYELGIWVAVQRRNRNNKNRMNPKRRKLLESLPGWSWGEKYKKS